MIIVVSFKVKCVKSTSYKTACKIHEMPMIQSFGLNIKMYLCLLMKYLQYSIEYISTTS